MMKPLGDPHNFGKRVTLIAEERIFKPRNLYWEWLFLSRESPFRRQIEEIASTANVLSPFQTIPDLMFNTDSLITGGTVKRLRLTPLSTEQLTPQLCEAVGAVIGLVTAMGIADLHHDNIAFGNSPDGKPIFTPLDIESALETYTLPSQTQLLPSTEMPEELCGVSPFRKLLCNQSPGQFDLSIAAAAASGYLQTVELLVKHAPVISETLASQRDIQHVPIRLFLRATRQYYSYLNQTEPIMTPRIQDAELEQLNRGDIPYFVRCLDSKQVFIFTEANTLAPVHIDSALTERALSNSALFPANQKIRLFSDPSKNASLFKAGALQLLRYWDDKKRLGRFEYGDLSCEFDAESIFLTWKDQLKVKCARK